MDGGHSTCSLCGQGTLRLIAKGGRADGADPVDGGGGRLRGGQAACIPHGNGHGAGEQVAGAQCIRSGHAGHGAVQLLKGAVQRHLGDLAHAEIGGIGGGEFQRQQHFGAVADDGDLLPAGHLVALGDLQGAHGAIHLGTHILAVHHLVIATLCLLHGDLSLFKIGGSIRAVQRVEDAPLIQHVALLKLAGEHLALHQRFHGVGVGRVQGAGAAQGVGDIPHFRAGLQIAGVHGCGAGLLGLEQKHTITTQTTGTSHFQFFCKNSTGALAVCAADVSVPGFSAPSFFLFQIIMFLLSDSGPPGAARQIPFLCIGVVYRILPGYTSVQISFERFSANFHRL